MSLQVQLLKQQIEHLIAFLQPRLSLANCHMVEFFTRSSYNKCLPLDIREEVDRIGVQNAINLLLKNDLKSAPALKTFIDNTKNFTSSSFVGCLKAEDFIEHLKTWGSCDIDKFKLEIFMTPKKSHEVEVLSSVAAAVSKIANVSHVIDIGDGKGYLSSMLALRHKIPVLGVDSSIVHTDGAIKRIKKLSRVWKGVVNKPKKSYPSKSDETQSPDVDLYRQVTQYISEDCDLQKLVSGIYRQDSSNLGLVGLHTCGNLAPNSLKIFGTRDYVKTICNVGCCYHLLTERFEESSEGNGPNAGFPMSQFLINKKIVIGRSARMVASQSVDRVLEKKELPSISIFYRALLQVLFEERCNEVPTRHVGKFRKPCSNFTEYARKAMDRVKVDVYVSDEELEKLQGLYQERLSELNLFYLLRCQLSPVIESLILLDRLLYLYEQGFKRSFLVQLFNPVISPRCYGIVSIKGDLLQL